jgi:hypothetical protein
MENNKYYTPDLTEFRIGFECEKYNPILDGHQIDVSKKGTWSKYITDKWFPRIDPSWFRVKYLDEEDIESIGFKHIGGKLLCDVGQEYSWNNKRYWVHLNYTKLSDHCVIKIETSVEEYSIKTLVVHSIGIKNKSELLILFKQLNIL